MSAGAPRAVAPTFVWLGMVLAISFLEAPLLGLSGSLRGDHGCSFR